MQVQRAIQLTGDELGQANRRGDRACFVSDRRQDLVRIELLTKEAAIQGLGKATADGQQNRSRQHPHERDSGVVS
jgi:hypothetical protein